MRFENRLTSQGEYSPCDLVQAVIERFESKLLAVELNRFELANINADFTTFHGIQVSGLVSDSCYVIFS